MSTFDTRPRSIIIIGKGDSELEYRLGSRPEADEIWGINDVGLIYPDLDKLWAMDDLVLLPNPCPFTVECYRNYKNPVITSRAYKEFPSSVEFPLEDARQYFCDYDITQRMLASTLAFMLLYAEMTGVIKISLYGVDFTEDIPQLTMATAFMLGRLAHKGVIINLPEKSRLLNLNENSFYGYKEI